MERLQGIPSVLGRNDSRVVILSRDGTMPIISCRHNRIILKNFVMIVRVNSYPNFGVNQNCYYGLSHLGEES